MPPVAAVPENQPTGKPHRRAMLAPTIQGNNGNTSNHRPIIKNVSACADTPYLNSKLLTLNSEIQLNITTSSSGFSAGSMARAVSTGPVEPAVCPL